MYKTHFNSKMLLFNLFGKFLSTYNKICNGTSFASFANPYDRTRVYFLVRGSILRTSNSKFVCISHLLSKPELKFGEGKLFSIQSWTSICMR